MPHLLLLTSEGCTPCLRVKRILRNIQAESSDISIEEMQFTSPAGSKLAIENNVLYPPAVFLNGRLIAKGKVYGEQIAAALRSLAGPA